MGLGRRGPGTAQCADDRPGRRRPRAHRFVTDVTERTARSQSRLALITAMVALVSAIAGPLVSLKINSDQLTGQRLIAQLAAMAQQSDYLRTQRWDAYAQFATAFSDASLAVLDASAVLRVAGISPDGIESGVSTATQKLGAVTQSYYALSLVGSRRAVAKAGDVLTAVADLHQALLAQVAGYRDDAVGSARYQQLSDAVMAAYDRSAGTNAEFVTLARSDVQADGPR